MKRREDAEPNWPAEFAEFDPEKWESKFDWGVARIRWARSQGYRQYKILPLVQAVARAATGVESNSDDEDGA